MTTDELMAMVDGLCEAAYSAQDTEALRASLRTALEAVVEVPAGFALVAVRGLDDLVEALERADRKGYMPDAISDAWDAFNIAPIPAAPASDADSMPAQPKESRDDTR